MNLTSRSFHKISLFQLLRFTTFTERLYCRSSCLISSRQAAMYLPSWSLLFRIPLSIAYAWQEWRVLNVERVPDQVVQVLVEHPLQVTLHLLQGHDCRPCSEIAWQCIYILSNRQQAEVAAGMTNGDRTTYDSLRQMQTYGKLWKCIFCFLGGERVFQSNKTSQD